MLIMQDMAGTLLTRVGKMNYQSLWSHYLLLFAIMFAIAMANKEVYNKAPSFNCSNEWRKIQTPSTSVLAQKSC